MTSSFCDCLSDEQIRSLKRAFDCYDSDKDGKLDIEGFKSAMKLIGIVPTCDEFKSMCRDIDSDTVLLSDFIAVVYYFLRGADSPEELIRAFAVFDSDQSGYMNIEMILSILSNLKHPMPEDQINAIISRHDNDGQIDYAAMIRELRTL